MRYLQANIELIGEVVVARQDIATGQLITAELLTTEQMDLSRASQQSVYAVSELIGQVSRRQIRSGPARAKSHGAPTTGHSAWADCRNSSRG